MRKVKTKKKLKRPLMALTLIYAISIFIFCYVVIARLDASIVTHASSNGWESAAKGNRNLTASEIPNGAKDLSFSYDDNYCTYLYNSEIYVVNMGTNKVVKKISEKSGIKKSMLMGNRNILMYFSLANNKLKLETYNIESGMTTVQKIFGVPVNSDLKSVDYSNTTNLIYISMEQDKDGNRVDSVYSLNIMKNIKRINPRHIIDNILLATYSPALYFEDDNNSMYYDSKPIEGIGKATIIGCDANDDVYARALDDKSTIYVINKNNLIKKIKFNDLNFIRFYTNKNSVYAVYKNYIASLTDDSRLNYSNDLRFVGMGGQNAYFEDANSNIVWMKRTI